MKIYKSPKIAKIAIRRIKATKKKHGKTLTEFKQKLKKWGIISSFQYQIQRKKLNLPGKPHKIYEDEWISWTDLFDRPARRIIIPISTYAKWKKEVRRNGIRTSREYKKVFKNYEGFPSNPNYIYKNKWEGWQKVFGRKSYKKSFLSWNNFLISVREAGITSYRAYSAFIKKYNFQDKWPSDPRIKYCQWVSWYDTLEKKRPTYKQLLIEVRKAGLKNCSDYFKERKKHPFWPDNPARAVYYSKEWISWKHFFGPNYKHNRGRPRNTII